MEPYKSLWLDQQFSADFENHVTISFAVSRLLEELQKLKQQNQYLAVLEDRIMELNGGTLAQTSGLSEGKFSDKASADLQAAQAYLIVARTE